MNYTLIRAKKRTLSLQVNRAGEVVARAPLYMPKFLIDQFVKQKSVWISKRLVELKKPKSAPIAHFTVSELTNYIKQEVDEYSQKMGLKPAGLRFTEVNSYWGTCSPKMILSFNLALRFTPARAVTYVVVHELAHLRWRGHGKRFWELVSKHCPETRELRKILRGVRLDASSD